MAAGLLVPGVRPHEGFGLEPAYLQVMLGKGRPDLMTYKDQDLQQARDAHLVAPRP